MKTVNKLQWLIIAVGLLLFVLLFFANRKPVKKAEEIVGIKSSEKIPDLEGIIKSRISALQGDDKKSFELFEKKLTDVKVTSSDFDSIIRFWDSRKQPDVASWYSYKKADKFKEAATWFKAGERFYFAVRFIKEQAVIPALYHQAILCFNAGLLKDSNNVDARIMLASCYVEGTPDPMKGIGMLKEIEKKDSNNVNLQMSFASFSAKSGQWEKAIQRYKNVLSINPNYIEAYLYLADAFERTGNIKMTKESLEAYASKTDDPGMKEQIEKYIAKLK